MKRRPLSQIGWNLDSLLIHIMLNKRTSGAQRDVQLLRSALDSFESDDPQHEDKSASDALVIMYKIAKEAVAPPHEFGQE